MLHVKRILWNRKHSLDNVIESSKICATRDPRRTSEIPQEFDITILQPKPWRTVQVDELKRDRHRAIQVTLTGGSSAIFLPSVWSERKEWSAATLVSTLAQKASRHGDKDTSIVESIFEIDVYIIAEDKSTNYGYFKEEKYIRPASYAGTWYLSSLQKLSKQLDTFLSNANNPLGKHAIIRGGICPHAGFKYSGQTAAFTYQFLDDSKMNRIVLLGPSHFQPWKDVCKVTSASAYNTPFGPLEVDEKTSLQLRESGKFDFIPREVDEKEHSLEMQMPFISHLSPDCKIVPILVGSLSESKEKEYGKLLAPFFMDPHTFVVVSSDFCHWGQRFNYTYYDKFRGSLMESIHSVDANGMLAISSMDPAKFKTYLAKARNTICGRHAISIMMHAIQNEDVHITFLDYSQSNIIKDPQLDSLVTYVSGIIHT